MDPTSAVFSSARSDWRTPPALWRPLVEEFGITLDVCASPENAIVPRYIGPGHHDPILRDALFCEWGKGEVCFMNPPYSRDQGIDIAPFVEAAQDASASNIVIALLPARTDTRWWHAEVMRADEVRLIPHRITFLLPDGTPAPSGAAFPSAVVIWRPTWNVRGRAPRFVTWDYL